MALLEKKCGITLTGALMHGDATIKGVANISQQQTLELAKNIHRENMGEREGENR
jgi:hypothetical protein